jgi:hypothetical protein
MKQVKSNSLLFSFVSFSNLKSLKLSIKAKKRELIEELKEGYIMSREEDKQISKDWEATIGDGIEN